MKLSLFSNPQAADRAFERVLLAAVSVSLIGALASGQLDLFPTLVTIFFFIGVIFFRLSAPALPALAWRAAATLAIGYSLVRSVYPTRDFESALFGILSLLISALVIGYFTRESARRELAIILLSLLLIAATTILSTSILFLLFLLVYLVLALSAVMLHLLKEEAKKAAEREISLYGAPEDDALALARARAPVPGRFYAFSSGSAVVILITGFCLFFLIPRMGRGIFAQRISLQERVTGFSETMRFGDFGRIIESNALVMRFKLEGADPEKGPYYMRGNALDRYENKSWRDSRGLKTVHYMRFQQPIPLSKVSSLDKLLKQEIVLEPVNTAILFGLPRITAVDIPPPFRALDEYKNGYIGLRGQGAIFNRTAYTVWSEPSPAGLEACRADFAGRADYSSQPSLDAFLQLPSGSEDIASLARQIAGNRTDPCGRAFAVKDYFAKNFTYSLQTPSDAAADPVKDFLFNSKTGYCEYFATATVLMLRGLGIPARIATGYLASDYNPIEGFFRVTQSSAHAWAEVLLPSGEWLLLDPTPPPSEEGQNAAFKLLFNLTDAIVFRWDRYVVDLSIQDQIGLAEQARDRTFALGQLLRDLPPRIVSVVRGLMRNPALFAALAIVTAAFIFWGRREVKRKGSDGRPWIKGLSREYDRLLAELARRGFARGPAETLLELSARVEAALPLPGRAFREATALYQEVRFGGRADVGPAAKASAEAVRVLRGQPPP